MWIPFINDDLSAFLSFQHHSRGNSQKCCTTSEGDAGDIDNFLVQSNNKQVSSVHFVCVFLFKKLNSMFYQLWELCKLLLQIVLIMTFGSQHWNGQGEMQFRLFDLRVVKSSRLLAKIVTYFVSIGWLLCLAFLYGWHFSIKYHLTGKETSPENYSKCLCITYTWIQCLLSIIYLRFSVILERK